jgi:predicted nicotinamide N-methyase
MNTDGATLGRYETQVYAISVADRLLRLLGPRYPHALNDDPEVRRRGAEDGYKPWWAQPWPAAVMLAEHVLRHTTAGPGLVLELGAGLGLAGLALAQAGYRVVVTDYDDDALDFVRASAALNGIQPHAVQRLDWRQPPAEHYDTIVASDVLYEKRHHAPILALLSTCLAPRGQVFISDQNRSSAAAFPALLPAAGFACVATAAQAKAIPAFDSRDGRVFDGQVYRIFRVCDDRAPAGADGARLTGPLES